MSKETDNLLILLDLLEDAREYQTKMKGWHEPTVVFTHLRIKAEQVDKMTRGLRKLLGIPQVEIPK